MATYLNLNKRKAKQAVVDSDAPVKPTKFSDWGMVDKHGLPAGPPVSPFTLFYPEQVATQIELVPEPMDRARSPEFQERTMYRGRKKAYFEREEPNFDPYTKGNLVTIHKAFMQLTSDDGRLTRENFGKAMHALGVTEKDIADRTFNLFDARKDNVVEYKEIISALHVILNGTNNQYTYKDCFQLFDTNNCGYIIRPCVAKLKEMRAEQSGINHLMVKTLLDIFDKLQAESEEKLRKEWMKKNKKKKPKPKKDAKKGGDDKGKEKKKDDGKPKRKEPVMPAFSPKIHLSYEEFSGFMATDPALVQSFLTTVLHTMESVYNRNRRRQQVEAADRAAADQEKDDAESTATGAGGGGGSIAAGSAAPPGGNADAKSVAASVAPSEGGKSAAASTAASSSAAGSS